MNGLGFHLIEIMKANSSREISIKQNGELQDFIRIDKPEKDKDQKQKSLINNAAVNHERVLHNSVTSIHLTKPECLGDQTQDNIRKRV